MAKNKIYNVQYGRKRKGKTNYKKRLRYLLSDKPRIVIRRSLKNMLIQSVKYNEEGDNVLETIKSTDLKKYGWDLPTGNIPSAYLTGLLFAKKSKIKEGVVDLGQMSITKGSRLTATIKGLADGGLKINYSEKIIPKEETIKGKYSKFKNIQKFEEVKANILK